LVHSQKLGWYLSGHSGKQQGVVDDRYHVGRRFGSCY